MIFVGKTRWQSNLLTDPITCNAQKIEAGSAPPGPHSTSSLSCQVYMWRCYEVCGNFIEDIPHFPEKSMG